MLDNFPQLTCGRMEVEVGVGMDTTAASTPTVGSKYRPFVITHGGNKYDKIFPWDLQDLDYSGRGWDFCRKSHPEEQLTRE